MFRDVISGTKFKFKCFSTVEIRPSISLYTYFNLLHYIEKIILYTFENEFSPLYSCNMKLKNYLSANIYQYLQPTGERTTYVRSFYFFQTKKQRRVFVCNSSAAVRPAVIRHGARTRSQHRNFRERGQEGVSGWAKTSNYISLPPPLLFQKKIKRRHFEMRLILSWQNVHRFISFYKQTRFSKRINDFEDKEFWN